MFVTFVNQNNSLMQKLIKNIGMTCQNKPPTISAASRFRGGFLFVK
jgi:hypothetical protein